MRSRANTYTALGIISHNGWCFDLTGGIYLLQAVMGSLISFEITNCHFKDFIKQKISN